MPFRLRCVTALLAFVAALPVVADDNSARQKKVALANLAKAEITKAVTVETNDLIVCATLPQAKTKQLADLLQKSHALGHKVLQFDTKDSIWKGKLTVYYLPESSTYKNFIRTVAQERPDDPRFFSLRGVEPYLVDSGSAGEKVTEADQFGEAGAFVATALLMNKSGTATRLPEWLRDGFGRAVALQAEGKNSKRYTVYKTAARRIVLGTSGRGPLPLSEVWDGKGKDSELLATSLIEFLVFGSGNNENFLKFVKGFRPTQDNASPGVPEALEAAKWKLEALDAAWRKWVQSGK